MGSSMSTEPVKAAATKNLIDDSSIGGKGQANMSEEHRKEQNECGSEARPIKARTPQANDLLQWEEDTPEEQDYNPVGPKIARKPAQSSGENLCRNDGPASVNGLERQDQGEVSQGNRNPGKSQSQSGGQRTSLGAEKGGRQRR